VAAVKHNTRDPLTGKPFSLCRSGHCQTDGHRTCRFFPRYETPSVVIVCSCECHDGARTDVRAMKPKGQMAGTMTSRLVPKK
jgi:hypothetical protein